MTSDTRSVDRDAFLAAMRQVAATVTVVTTDGLAGRAGATVSAFSSLSADPPSVLVCLRTDSRIARAVIENGAFCVNVLAEDAVEVARAFAGPSPGLMVCQSRPAPKARYCRVRPPFPATSPTGSSTAATPSALAP